jgi:hypothetical protein
LLQARVAGSVQPMRDTCSALVALLRARLPAPAASERPTP